MRPFQRLLLLAGILWLAACSQPPAPTPSMAASERPGPGRAQGEAKRSNTRKVDFERASADTPSGVATVYYRNNSGGLSLGFTRLSPAEGVQMTILSDRGDELPMDPDCNDRWEIFGKAGERYQIVLRNTGRSAYEVVSTVDGRDVISGRPGSYANHGYLIYPGDTLVINGFRKNEREVAEFRFASVAESCAASSRHGDTANVGVIGVALFVERDALEAERRRNANPLPTSRQPPPTAIISTSRCC